MAVRRGPLTNERVVVLTCGHEQTHATAEVGDDVGCLACPQRRVTRSHLNGQTFAMPRRVAAVGVVPVNRVVYSIG